MLKKGVVKLSDLLDGNYQFKQWKIIKLEFDLLNCQVAYDKLLHNLDLAKATVQHNNKVKKIYTHCHKHK